MCCRLLPLLLQLLVSGGSWGCFALHCSSPCTDTAGALSCTDHPACLSCCSCSWADGDERLRHRICECRSAGEPAQSKVSASWLHRCCAILSLTSWCSRLTWSLQAKTTNPTGFTQAVAGGLLHVSGANALPSAHHCDASSLPAAAQAQAQAFGSGSVLSCMPLPSLRMKPVTLCGQCCTPPVTKMRWLAITWAGSYCMGSLIISCWLQGLRQPLPR